MTHKDELKLKKILDELIDDFCYVDMKYINDQFHKDCYDKLFNVYDYRKKMLKKEKKVKVIKKKSDNEFDNDDDDRDETYEELIYEFGYTVYGLNKMGFNELFLDKVCHYMIDLKKDIEKKLNNL